MKRKTISVCIFLILLILSCGPPTPPPPTLAPSPTPTPTPIPEGYVEIPDVIGMTREDAYELLEELGLVPLTFWVVHTDYSYGQVTDVEPGAGEVVALESEVVLDVVGEVINGKDSGGGGGSKDCGPQPGFECNSAFQEWCECSGGVYSCHLSAGVCSFP